MWWQTISLVELELLCVKVLMMFGTWADVDSRTFSLLRNINDSFNPIYYTSTYSIRKLHSALNVNINMEIPMYHHDPKSIVMDDVAVDWAQSE